MSELLEPNFNGLPKPTDWTQVIIPLQQANEKAMRGATLPELGANLKIEMSVNAQRVPSVPPGALVAGPDDREVFMEIKVPGSWTWKTDPPLTNAQGDISTFWWDKTDWKKNDRAALPIPDLSEVLKKNEVGTSSIDFTEYILIDTVVTTIGTATTNAVAYAGAKSIVNMPIPLGVWTIGGYVVNAGKNLALVNADGQVKAGSVQTLGSSKVSFTIENDGYSLLRVFFKSMTTSEATDAGWINTMTITAGSEYQPASVNEILDKPIISKGLTQDNKTPLPVEDYNAVNLYYLKTFGLLASDLTVTPSKNLAIQDLNISVIPHKYISNTGAIATGQYWYMYKFYPLRSGLKAGDPFVIGNFSINTAGYSAWYEGDILKMYNGSYRNQDLPKNFTVPIDATTETILYFDLARPVDIDSFKNLVINYGTTLIPYENPYGSISKIKGRDIGGVSSKVSKFSDLIDVPKYAGNQNKALKINDAGDGLDVFDPVLQNTDVVLSSVSSPLGQFEILIETDIPVWNEISIAPIAVGFTYLFPDGGGNFFRKVRGI